MGMITNLLIHEHRRPAQIQISAKIPQPRMGSNFIIIRTEVSSETYALFVEDILGRDV
jgi:hypothetical protein